MPRGLRERWQNSHRATARAIRHAHNHKRVERARVWFSPKNARTTKNEHWKCQTRGLSNFFVEVYKVSIAPATKKLARSAAPATQNFHHVQNDKRRQFHKTRFSTLSKRGPCSPNTWPTIKNDFQNHLSFWPTAESATPATRMKKKSDVLHLSVNTYHKNPSVWTHCLRKCVSSLKRLDGYRYRASV